MNNETPDKCSQYNVMHDTVVYWSAPCGLVPLTSVFKVSLRVIDWSIIVSLLPINQTSWNVTNRSKKQKAPADIDLWVTEWAKLPRVLNIR